MDYAKLATLYFHFQISHHLKTTLFSRTITNSFSSSLFFSFFCPRSKTFTIGNWRILSRWRNTLAQAQEECRRRHGSGKRRPFQMQTTLQKGKIAPRLGSPLSGIESAILLTFAHWFCVLQSCCGKTNLFKHFGDQNKTLGKLCYDEVSEKLKQGTVNCVTFHLWAVAFTLFLLHFRFSFADPQSLETQNLFSCDKYKMMKKLQYVSIIPSLPALRESRKFCFFV